MFLLVIVLFFLYLKSVKLGARLDFFDVHLNENMSKLYLYQSQWKKGQDIAPDSYMANWFTRKIIRIYSLTDDKLLTDAAQFKPTYIQAFYNSSKIMREILEVIRTNSMAGMNKMQRFRMKL